MLVDFSDVAHNTLPVRSFNLAHFVDILQINEIKFYSRSSTFRLTKVVLMPTLSAAENAKLKLRFLSCGVNSSYGIISGRYECIRAQSAIPSFQLELEKQCIFQINFHDCNIKTHLKFVMSMFLYPTVLFWHHLRSALRFDPPFFTNALRGSLRSPGKIYL